MPAIYDTSWQMEAHYGVLASYTPMSRPTQPGTAAPLYRIQGFDTPDPNTFPMMPPGYIISGAKGDLVDTLDGAKNSAVGSGPQARAPRPDWKATWQWVAPPGIGDAPQMVWQTYWLVPGSLKGPGDNPIDMRRSLQPPPVAQGYRATLFGRPIDAGSYLYRALSNYTPVGNPAPLGLGLTGLGGA